MKEFNFKYEGNYSYPSIDLLNDYDNYGEINEKELQSDIKVIIKTLNDFQVDVKLKEYQKSYQYTKIIFKIISATPVKKILLLENNIKISLVKRMRMVPSTNVNEFIIEVENFKKEIAPIKAAIKKINDNDINFCVGFDSNKSPKIISINNASHILIGGISNSGKSQLINDIITELIYNYSPKDLRLLLIDLKYVELNQFASIPHLLTKEIITEPRYAISAFEELEAEMERRFNLFRENNVRDIFEYNKTLSTPLPTIITIIDEYNMLKESTNKKKLNDIMSKLISMAKSSGIHLIISSQFANDLDVSLKANIPTKIAFVVTKRADSLKIIGNGDAINLLGHGDLILSYYGETIRLQAPFVSLDEIDKVVNFIKQF